MDLAQALERATAHSAAVSAAQHEIDALDGAVMQAGAWRNPTLSVNVEDTRRDTRTTATTLDIPLELGGQRAARQAAAQRSRDAAVAALNDTRAQLRVSVTSAYVAVLVAQERTTLAADALALAQHAAQAVSRRVAAGKVSPVDASRAQVDQANAELELAEAQSESTTARHALARLWGEAEPRFERVSGDLQTLPPRAPLHELMARLDDAPVLHQARLEVERRQALVDLERSRGVPDVTLSVGAQRDNTQGRTQALIGLSVPLPLFDRNQGALHEASRRVEQARDQRQLARQQAVADLQAAAAQLAVAHATLQALQSTVLPAAQQAHRSASLGFEAGKFGFLEVLDAQRSLLQARTRHLNALASAHQAAAAIDRLLGQ